MDTFAFQDFRDIIRTKLQESKKTGKASRLAAALGVSSSLVSQVLNGSKCFSEDQAYLAATHLGLSEKELNYFLLLARKERAQSHALKENFARQIRKMQQDSKRVKGRIEIDKELSFEDQAIYYSSWLFAAIWTMSSIEKFQTLDAIATHLDAPLRKVRQVADWLVLHGLCAEEKGRLTARSVSMFVDRDSLLAARHHANWRQKAQEAMTRFSTDDFFFTAPMSISVADFDEVRQQLVHFVESLCKQVKSTNPELTATINLDLFRV